MKEIFFDGFMIFCPIINYSFQVLKFKNTKSSKGFSTYLCLVNLLAHTLKIFFWFKEKFRQALLIQSFSVIIMQLYLIYLCIKYKENGPDYEQENKNVMNINNINGHIFCNWKQTLNYKLIWKWNNIVEYYKFYFFFIFLLSIFYISCNDNYYINIIGALIVFLEMLCSLPLIIEVYKTKNQKNISKLMVLMWFIGNILKVFYNIYNKSPIQLVIGTYVQVFCNIILISQLIYYYHTDNGEKNAILIDSDSNSSNKIIFDGNNDITPNDNEEKNI
jgi:uncharacterized protein with PQ loop repeat